MGILLAIGLMSAQGGGVLTLADDQATMNLTERWSLSDRGRTLAVHSVFPGGAEDVKVFAMKA